MALGGLVRLAGRYKEFQKLREQKGQIVATGLSGSQKSLLAALLAEESDTTAIITYSEAQADRIAQDIETLIPGQRVYVFDSNELMPHEEAAKALDLRVGRLEVLARLRQPNTIITASIQALLEGLMPPGQFYARVKTITWDTRLDILEFSSHLADIGYERVDKVEGYGQFSVRGGIIDFFPVTQDNPVRIELFDDEIDSMRLFELETQRSLDKVSQVQVFPAREVLLPSDIDTILEKISTDAQQQSEKLRKLGQREQAEQLQQTVARHLELLTEHGHFDGIDQYKPYFYPLATLLDYLPKGARLLVDEPVRLKDYAESQSRDYQEIIANLLERGKALPLIHQVFLEWNGLWKTIQARKPVYLSVLAKRISGMENCNEIGYPGRLPEHFQGSMERVTKKIKQWRKDHFRTLLVVSNKERGARLKEHLQEEDIPCQYVDDLADELKAGNCVITLGNLETGMEFPGFKIAVLTELELYGKKKPKQRTAKVDEKLRISPNELKVGDYVVHVNHGIGQYLGVETLEVGGVHKDYLLVKYAGQDKLYVPTDQIDLLQRYVGLEEQAPKLSKLGGNEWSRVKKRVKESVQEMAEGLLQLYAEREAIKGHPFPEDTPWQREFEDAFPYEETPDQLQAISEVKRDMQRYRPMDRLLCGDVGYGKTEVSIRAAFKAVNDGKQVAVLVPTTILAQQHHRTFTERFGEYPINIKVMSRFQSQAEISGIKRGLKDGTVDIVIGTHRLLSKDVAMPNLGLVIVDEEQRFGVAQKERLKEISKTVDVLTLSATPIPRTLHMAMVGVRDMSVIETPPEDRYPIRTYVLEYDEQVVRQAIMRELSRQGQIYFVYNRVQSIDKMYRELSSLVPEARIAIAHGQMDEHQLERVMLDFYNGEFDILLCTTIIETGMDIPNVNTLIIYDADYLGLAQLYQLRGRVGRTNRVAYAYFTYRRDKILSEDAEKRLQAIKEFTDLGSGIKIAMRDLEIRGAGNLLGPEQHGFIASVGFEMYTKLLEEAISELKGEVVQKPPEPVLDLSVDAFISEEYVGDARQKVELYKKIMAITNLDEAGKLEEEVEDRFGDPPAAVRNLIQIARIKVLARFVGVASITTERDHLIIKMLEGLSISREIYTEMVRKYRGKIGYRHGRAPQLKMRVRDMDDPDILDMLLDIVRTLHDHSRGVAGKNE